METDAPGIYNEIPDLTRSLNTIISVEMCKVSQKYIDLQIAIPALLQKESTGACKNKFMGIEKFKGSEIWGYTELDFK